jgi:predicted dehydrogenase
MTRVGIIGCGHWGPNHIRIFSQLPQSRAYICADLDGARLRAIQTSFPDIKVTENYQDILRDPLVDAVCIAAPTGLHYRISRESLEAGKHVLCEKPLALTKTECEELAALAAEVRRVLVVGHIFLFNAGIIRLKEYIDSGEIGKVYYAYSTRTNLGPFRYDVNALWDLAPHDISILNYLFGGCPANVSGRGQRSLGTSQEDIAFATMEYPGNVVAHLHVSWLDPRKVRQITIVGEKKMVVWDDLDNVGPVKLYDKHVERTATFYETYGEFQLLSREGSITIPKVNAGEPLKAQALHFLECVENNKPSMISGAQSGRDVVETLCAIQTSIQQNGASVILG